MNIITQDLKFRQSVVKYYYRNGATATAAQYKIGRKTVYRWAKKYNGTIESLANESRRPHTNPRAHTDKEIKLIKDYKYKNKDTGLVVLWVKLRKAGYTRSITSLYRIMIKIGIYKKAPSKKKVYEPKEYQQMTYPGERVQVDVKYVPSKCLTKELKEQGERYYQYTAIDEYTRMRVLWFAKEHSTYESKNFVDIIVKKFPFKIKEIQTDNGFEFTNRLSYYTSIRDRKTMFEEHLEELGLHLHRLVAHVGDAQGGPLRHVDGEVAVDVGHHAVCSSTLHDGGTDDGLVRGVEHLSLYLHLLGEGGNSEKQGEERHREVPRRRESVACSHKLCFVHYYFKIS